MYMVNQANETAQAAWEAAYPDTPYNSSVASASIVGFIIGAAISAVISYYYVTVAKRFHEMHA